jgi:hypothetical protein
MILTRTLLFLLSVACLLPVRAEGQSAAVQELISVYSDLDDMCRGWPGDDPHSDEVCKTREKLRQALIKMGYCYGKNNQSRAQFSWHKCGPGSVR